MATLKISDSVRATMRTELLEIGESPTEIFRLVEQGKEPAVSTTPNGRLILACAGGFSVQPPHDNYWITVPTIDDAMAMFGG